MLSVSQGLIFGLGVSSRCFLSLPLHGLPVQLDKSIAEGFHLPKNKVGGKQYQGGAPAVDPG